MYAVRIYDTEGSLLAEATGENEAQLLYRAEYKDGDYAEFEASSEYVSVKADNSIEAARMYLPQRKFTYVFPLSGDGLSPYPPGSFSGNQHLLYIKPDLSNEYRAVSLNPLDQRRDTDAYPHATANVETRNESVFAARNVIDGVTISNGHGKWPYHSWGIGERTDAYLRLEFGRKVEIDAVDLHLRADFPHDAWWESGLIELSDGSVFEIHMNGIQGAQRVVSGHHVIDSLVLKNLKKCDNPSPFPALKQLTVYGKDTDREK